MGAWLGPMLTWTGVDFDRLQVEYPEIEESVKPRYRFMSAYEQRVETADKSHM